ncbi:MAG: amidase [Flavobacteriales bacterium]|nr:amidase [Flavobacteriales bacterium]MCB9205588.1 amidase [Flavobacteriales bacterium]
MTNRTSAFTNDALGNHDASGVAEAISKKEISPEEAIEAAIQRAEKVNDQLNAIVLRTYEDARQVENLNKDGAFFGVPTFFKDTDNIKGYPTQMGTGAFSSKKARSNSRFVNQFLSTGVSSLGKTTLPEFGLLCSTENERWAVTRNPWNTDYTSGGSSSGSAALVASGAVPIASGNDGAGSIRIPAAICGLVGLKPSRHRIYGIDGTEMMPIEIVHQGVLTRSVRDTALFYSEAEKFHLNKRLPAIGHVTSGAEKRLRIAFVENLTEGTTGRQDQDTYELQIRTAKLLESLGHTVEQVPLPIDVDTMVGHFLNYYGFLSYMSSHFGRLVFKAKVDKTLLEPFTTGLAARFKRNALTLPRSIREMRRMGKECSEQFEKYDVVMSPVLAHKTPKIGYFSPELAYEEVKRRAIDFATYTGLYNVTGEPAISLPLGIDSDGIPLGVQFAAPYGEDRRLLELAYELEQAQPWRIMAEI